MIICSISKLTMAAGSAPSPRTGTFIKSGKSMPGFETLQSLAIPPLWINPSITKPSKMLPGSRPGFAIALYLPAKSLSAKYCGRRAFWIASAAPSIS